MKQLILLSLTGLFCLARIQQVSSQDTTGIYINKSAVPKYEVVQAIEIESLFPMFVSGGYHAGLGYRYKHFRIRASVINGGDYNAEPAGLKNNKAEFKRYYKTSPGLFLGYNFWKKLELYSYLELHTFSIEQKASGIRQDLHSRDFGAGISYQVFFWGNFYLQPGLHSYFRADKSLDFNQIKYHIPNVDISAVIRVGVRLWQK